MRLVTRVLVVGTLLVALATAAEGQRRTRARPVSTVAAPHFGGHVGYNFDVDDILLGAQLSYPVSPRFDLYPSFDFYFVDNGSLWALNFDVKYRPRTRSGAFFVGGGINYSRISNGGNSGSDTNLNAFAGLEGRRRRVWPYAEARLILGDGSSFQLAGGLSWRL